MSFIRKKLRILLTKAIGVIRWRRECYFNNNTKCLYTNLSCLFCSDYMKEINGLDKYQHVSVNEIRKNRSQQLLLTIIGFIFSLTAIAISILTYLSKKN